MVRNVARFAAVPSARLVDHNPTVGQDEPLARASSGEKQGAHGSGLSHADGGNGTPDVVHGIVDGHARGDGATGGVDVHGNGLCRAVGF